MHYIVTDHPDTNGTPSMPIATVRDRAVTNNHPPPTEAELLTFAEAYPKALAGVRQAEKCLETRTRKLAQVTAILNGSTREDNRG